MGPSASTAIRHAWAVSLASAGRITRRFGHGPHGGQLLDGLVGGTVLAQPDRVVGPRVDDVDIGEGRHPDRTAHVVTEHEEGARRPAAMPPWAAMPFMTPPMPCSRIP